VIIRPGDFSSGLFARLFEHSPNLCDLILIIERGGNQRNVAPRKTETEVSR